MTNASRTPEQSGGSARKKASQKDADLEGTPHPGMRFCG
jgi:hypothetical protein